MSHIYKDHRLFFPPNQEFIAFEPIFIPNLAKFPSKLPPVCAFLLFPWFLYLLTILLATLCVVDGANLTFFFLIRLFLSPVVLVRLIVTFEGKFFLLTLSYLARKDVPFGNRTLCTVTCRHNSSFCLIVVFTFYHRKFF